MEFNNGITTEFKPR